MPSSYNGWTASKDRAAIGVVRFEPIKGIDYPGGIKGGDVEVVFTYLARQFHKRVERLDLPGQDDEWGYYYRLNRNSNNLSCHSSGTACDFNATRHPNGRAGTFTAKQVTQIRLILAELDQVVKWGGDFSRTKDEMHFEIATGKTAADVKKVADKIRRALTAKATPPPTDPRLHEGTQGQSVLNVQNALIKHGYQPDPAEVKKGYFGPGTHRALVAFQTAKGVHNDGVTWAATWAALRARKAA